jgi:hypothetical protein
MEAAQHLEPAREAFPAPFASDVVCPTPEGSFGCEAPANQESAPLPVVQCPIVAKRGDGTVYGGDLLADVLEYRLLRWRSLSGAILTPVEMRRFTHLESRVRQEPSEDPNGALRTYYRFECCFPGRVVFANAHGEILGLDVSVEDMSAGGVKIRCSEQLAAGERVELLLSIAGSEGTTRLPGRVAWTRGEHFGLMFAGAPA